MQGEDRVLELLAEVLRQQDQTQAHLQRISEEMREVKGDVRSLKVQADTILENQQSHQQALRMLATNQQKSQREQENIVDILDSVARMQRDLSRRLDRLENPGDFAR